MRPIHFISDLPRSGSTLLPALLLQNPAVHAGIASPLGSLVAALPRSMCQDDETSLFIDEAHRTRLLADSGHDADWLRADQRRAGIVPVIPGTRSRKRPIRHPKRRYRIAGAPKPCSAA